MKYRILVFSLLLGNVMLAFSQNQEIDTSAFVVSKTYLDKAYQNFYEEQKIAEANFLKVHPNDTSYQAAQTDLAALYVNTKEYDKVIEITKRAIAENYPSRSTNYINWMVSYMKLEKYEEAARVLEQAKAEFPKNNILLYDEIILLEESKQYDVCAEKLKEQLQANFYFSKHHLKAGLLARNEGEIAMMMMAIGHYLIQKAGTSEANSIITFANNAVQTKVDIEPVGFKFSKEGDDYSELNLLINNYLANNKKYKVPASGNLPLIKQFHLLMSKLEYDANDKGFFMQYYVPIYKKIIAEDRFNGFAYCLLASSKNETHLALYNKHASEALAFKTWFENELLKKYQKQELVLNGKPTKTKVWYDGDQNLEMIGDIVDGKGKGYVQIYHSTGALSAEGLFNNEGKKEGVWKRYYTDGKLKEESSYKNDLYEGKLVFFNQKGSKTFEGNLVEGELTGLAKYYNYFGRLTHTLTFSKGDLNGEAIYYNSIETMSSKYAYKDDKIEGEYTSFFGDGAVEEKGQFKAGNRVGKFTTYYNDGTLALERIYNEDGLYEGAYKSFYFNGKPEKVGQYAKGSQAGSWVLYYYDGAKQQEFTLDENGKLNGSSVEYDVDGLKFLATEYKKGDMVASTYFNKKGEIIRSNTTKGKTMEYIGYSPSGIKISEGKFLNHEKDGDWKFYHANGNLKADNKLIKGKTTGLQTYYFKSGILDKMYKDEDGESKNTLCLSYFDNGKMYEKGFYYEDQLAGEWTSYFRNGNVKRSTYFTNGNRSGVSKEYTIIGALDEEYYYENNTWVKLIQYDSTGKELHVQELKNGSGTCVFKTQEGKVYAELNYKNGGAHGSFTWYYPNGKIQTKGAYFNDERDGEWVWYHVNGKLEKTGQYKFAKKIGTWKDYDENGKLEEEYSYLNGELEGVAKEYYNENGVLSSTVAYRQGEKHGSTTFISEKGEISHVRNYNQGLVVSYSYLGKDKKLVEPIVVEGKKTEVVSYYANGTISRKYKLVNGMFDGKYEAFYEDGSKMSITNYNMSLRDGEALEYYKNGNIESKANYVLGDAEGKVMHYHSNGKLAKETNFICDERFGWSNYYNESGVLTLKVRYYNNIVDALK